MWLNIMLNLYTEFCYLLPISLLLYVNIVFFTDLLPWTDTMTKATVLRTTLSWDYFTPCFYRTHHAYIAHSCTKMSFFFMKSLMFLQLFNVTRVRTMATSVVNGIHQFHASAYFIHGYIEHFSCCIVSLLAANIFA